MARHRSATSPRGATMSSNAPWTSSTLQPPSPRSHSRRSNGARNGITQSYDSPRPPQLPISQRPSIRFVPYHDARSSRPSLAFSEITRTLPNTSSIIKVGRYSEKESTFQNIPDNVVSDAPVGFKSKVVSRRHCEFFYKGNQWHIQDVKSSSGTFLNHIRLSPPGEESKPFTIKDGDIVQLGIDFKGGEEMIFRCVKIRILCNRGWQRSINKFNKSAHKQLNELQRSMGNDVMGSSFKDSTECTICLNSIAPCQSLFIAPCSHAWHYKCIRPILDEMNRSTNSFQHFLCPNCRAVADLDADVDEEPLWDEESTDEQDAFGYQGDTRSEDAEISQPGELTLSGDQGTLLANIRDVSIYEPVNLSSFVSSAPGASSNGNSASLVASGISSATQGALYQGMTPTPRGVRARTTASRAPTAWGRARSPPEEANDADCEQHTTLISRASANSLGGTFDVSDLGVSERGHTQRINVETNDDSVLDYHQAQYALSPDVEGPMTPRNNAGPFVFDGSAGSSRDDLPAEASQFNLSDAPVIQNSFGMT